MFMLFGQFGVFSGNYISGLQQNYTRTLNFQYLKRFRHNRPIASYVGPIFSL